MAVMIMKTIASKTHAIDKIYKAEFLYNFGQLYQLPILRPLLNIIVSKAKHGLIEFDIQAESLVKRVEGSCKTESVFSKISGIFSKKHTIIIQGITPETIMHELAHAVEKESGIDLNNDFRKALGLDMKNREPSNMQLARAVKIITLYEMKGYKIKNVMEELFARYFELLAMSYEVGGWGKYQFYYADIANYFENTTKWIEQVFNKIISKKIDKEVLEWSNNLVKNLKPYEKKWKEKISFDSNAGKKQKWSARTKSIGDWQKSWEEFSGKKFKDKNNKN